MSDVKWKLVPAVGSVVKANHPITSLNPSETFSVAEVKCDGGRFYARGEETCWFNVDMLAASPSPAEALPSPTSGAEGDRLLGELQSCAEVATAEAMSPQRARDGLQQIFARFACRFSEACSFLTAGEGPLKALEPFATSCDNHFHCDSILDSFSEDASVLVLIRDGKLSPTGISVGDLRRAKQVYQAALAKPASEPAGGGVRTWKGELVEFPSDGELASMKNSEKFGAFETWARKASLRLHMAESGLGRFYEDDRTEWAWQAWLAALSFPASSSPAALPSETSGAEGVVKPLVYVKPYGAETLTKADTILGEACVWTHHEANGSWFWKLGNIASGTEANEVDAKKMLWATYEDRIRSTLAKPASEPAGGGVREAAAKLLSHLELYEFNERDPSGELNEFMAALKAALSSPASSSPAALPAGVERLGWQFQTKDGRWSTGFSRNKAHLDFAFVNNPNIVALREVLARPAALSASAPPQEERSCQTPAGGGRDG